MPDLGSDLARRVTRIALELFNAEGEGEVSALAIANAADISPGHLYYYFKGKGEIIAALLESHETELAMILAGTSAGAAESDAFLTYMAILIEELNDVRFLYKGLASIVRKYPDLRGRILAIVSRMRRILRGMLEALAGAGLLPTSEAFLEGLTERLLLEVLFRSSLLTLEQPLAPSREQVLRAALSATALVTSYVELAPAGR